MEKFSPPLFPALNEGLIRRVQKARRARASFFSEELFADPAWDILLELYACELAQRRVPLSKLSDAAAVPTTTLNRWLQKLEQDGLVARGSDPLHARRVWVKLTGSGASAMRRYFAAVSGTSLPL